ncbi:hypothetical protein BJ875DRAFT_544412 [Amylocarpus encephaloides]|uniref:Uncharacterized protein n=1 Tax=Amylocarpus encephaloides TaxID=45428 RepID=A0A9P7YG31_9HELO|nr:hypothetical protein BJ875DRAFT_544412 [Amylocarpus encephaloides]
MGGSSAVFINILRVGCEACHGGQSHPKLVQDESDIWTSKHDPNPHVGQPPASLVDVGDDGLSGLPTFHTASMRAVPGFQIIIPAKPVVLDGLRTCETMSMDEMDLFYRVDMESNFDPRTYPRSSPRALCSRDSMTLEIVRKITNRVKPKALGRVRHLGWFLAFKSMTPTMHACALAPPVDLKGSNQMVDRGADGGDRAWIGGTYGNGGAGSILYSSIHAGDSEEDVHDCMLLLVEAGLGTVGVVE